jgi:aminoglycoside phosphotransferase (APT) family kinase protein
VAKSCPLWPFRFGRNPSDELKAASIALDPATWERARGWAIWKALTTLVRHRNTNPTEAKTARQVIRDVLEDHSQA